MRHLTPLALPLFALLLTGCPAGKTGDTGNDATTGTGTGTGTGSPTGTATATATGTGTGTGSGTGTGTGTATGGVTRSLIVGCDPTFCTFTAAGGPFGGDLCSCTIDGPDHPTTSVIEAGCFGGTYAPVGLDLTFQFDLAGQGYAGYSVNSCLGYAGDTSIAAYDADPLAGGNEVECNEDAGGENSYCSKIPDPGYAGVLPGPVGDPGTGEVWVVVDEWDLTSVWNGATPRTVEFEFFTSIPSCGDGVPEFNEECDDGNTLNNDGCDEFCQREPVCGDGFVDAPEVCDDGNTLDGDGCDAYCEPEPLEIVDCDPTFCTMDLGLGPNGGDLCTCTLPGADHPLRNDLVPGCTKFGGYYGNGPEVILSFTRGSYASIAATNCSGTFGGTTTYGLYYEDSSISIYDDDPLVTGVEYACNDDAQYELAGCAKLWDTAAAGVAPDLVNLPATGGSQVYVVVDDTFGLYFNGVDDRIIEVELSTATATVCGDGTPEQFEECDDGNNVDGDGCDQYCQIEPLVLDDCDPTYCTLTLGSGPNGGDMCDCLIPAASHPQSDVVGEATCFGGGSGNELLMHFDLNGTGYTQYAIDTCSMAPYGAIADSSVATFDDDPNLGGLELACSEDAFDYYNVWCSKITDTPYGVPPTPDAAPASLHLWVQIDEYDDGAYSYWDGVTDRAFSIELIP